MERMFYKELIDGICEGRYTYDIYQKTSLGNDPIREYLTFTDVKTERSYTIPLKKCQAEMLKFLINSEQEKCFEKNIFEIR